MVDTVNEWRAVGREITQKEEARDAWKKLNSLKEVVSRAIKNYETYIRIYNYTETTQEPSTSTEQQQQPRLLNPPQKPDSGSSEQGIVKMIDSIFFMIQSFLEVSKNSSLEKLYQL